MLTVRLHGHLEERFGAEFHFEAATVREVIDALQANFPDFTEEFIRDERAYNILVDLEMQNLTGCVQPVKTDSEIDIVPIIMGAGNIFATVGLIILGAVLVLASGGIAAGIAGGIGAMGTSATAAAIGMGITQASIASSIAAIGWGLALAGVASLLAGPDGPGGDGTASSSLGTTENIIGQGLPVPIGYGRMMVGSIVLSATYASNLVKISSAYTYKNTSTGLWEDHHMTFGQEWDASELATADDGYTFPYTVSYDYGYSAAAWVALQAWYEARGGGGEYVIVNYTPVAGTTIPIPKYIPPDFTGTFANPYDIRA